MQKQRIKNHPEKLFVEKFPHEKAQESRREREPLMAESEKEACC